MRLWSLADGSCLRTFEGHLSSVLRLDFLSAGTQILSAGADGLIKLWSIRLSGGCPVLFQRCRSAAPLPVLLHHASLPLALHSPVGPNLLIQ